MKANALGLISTILVVSASPALAAYTRTTSAPVYIQSIYQNELGSPFVYFSASVNSACGGMYLYDITASPGDVDLRKSKMAIALAAKLAEKRVVLDYYYDPGISGWSACYIQGIQLVD